MDQFHVLLIIAWLVYAALHSIMAGVWFKKGVERIAGTYYKYYRPFYSLFAAVTLLALLIYQFNLSSPALYSPRMIHFVIAIPLLIAGLIVMGICIKKYFMNLSGIDVLIKKPRTGVLEKTGLHAYVRHPLYSGTLLFVWALFMMFPLVSNLVACVMMTLYTLVGIRMEEQKLFLEFGESYRTYASSVPMLIPGLKK
jgi:protein-S-isoprenylcysteine O-methyltransferase Ste14